MNRVSAKRILIRLLYFIPFAFFIYALYESRSDLDQLSSFGLTYDVIIIVPIVIFLYQAIRNSIIGWVMVMLLFLTFYGTLLVGAVDIYEQVGGKHDWQFFYTYIGIIVLTTGIGFLYLKIRPTNNMI